MNFLCEEHSQHLFEFAFNVHTFWAECTVVRAFPCVSVKVLSQVGRLLEPANRGWERGEGAHAKDENERVHARDEEVREFMQICFLRKLLCKEITTSFAWNWDGVHSPFVTCSNGKYLYLAFHDDISTVQRFFFFDANPFKQKHIFIPLSFPWMWRHIYELHSSIGKGFPFE